MSFKTVKPIRTLETTLSTGTVMRIAHARSEQGEDAWCVHMSSEEGEEQNFGISHEAFQTFVGGVAKLYAEDVGIKLKE